MYKLHNYTKAIDLKQYFIGKSKVLIPKKLRNVSSF